jgi:hypothetical protein
MSDSQADIAVAGLIMRMQPYDEAFRPLSSTLCGPVVLAGIGARIHRSAVRLLTLLPADLSQVDKQVISCIDPIGNLCSPSVLPAISWVGPAVSSRKSKPRILGNPAQWHVNLCAETLNCRAIILTSADPKGYIDILSKVQRSFVSLDLQSDMILNRSKILDECLRHIDLITVTEHDLAAIPRHFISNYINSVRNPFLIIKRAERGITVRHMGNMIDLPAPEITVLRNDVGAGDLLVGALTAEIIGKKEYTFRGVCEAYHKCTSTVARLLSASHLEMFIHDCVKEFAIGGHCNG